LTPVPGFLNVCFQWPDLSKKGTFLLLKTYKDESASALVAAAEAQLSLQGKLSYITQWQEQTLSGLLQTAKNGILILKVDDFVNQMVEIE
jgi:hypothetical protein